MPAVESQMLPIGTIAPDFSLLNPKEDRYNTLTELKSDKATVIMFICNHCPYVKHLNIPLIDFAEKYKKAGVAFIAINANDYEAYPEDSPENMVKYANGLGYNFPYLFDDSQETARAYRAACTPDFYLFDSEMKLAYRGQFDSSRPNNNIIPNGADLGNALEAVLLGNKPDPEQFPSIGCGIKWKKE